MFTLSQRFRPGSTSCSAQSQHSSLLPGDLLPEPKRLCRPARCFCHSSYMERKKAPKARISGPGLSANGRCSSKTRHCSLQAHSYNWRPLLETMVNWMLNAAWYADDRGQSCLAPNNKAVGAAAASSVVEPLHWRWTINGCEGRSLSDGFYYTTPYAVQKRRLTRRACATRVRSICRIYLTSTITHNACARSVPLKQMEEAGDAYSGPTIGIYW